MLVDGSRPPLNVDSVYTVYIAEDIAGHIIRDRVYGDEAQRAHSRGGSSVTVFDWLALEYLLKGYHKKFECANSSAVGYSALTRIRFEEYPQW